MPVFANGLAMGVSSPQKEWLPFSAFSTFLLNCVVPQGYGFIKNYVFLRILRIIRILPISGNCDAFIARLAFNGHQGNSVW